MAASSESCGSARHEVAERSVSASSTALRSARVCARAVSGSAAGGSGLPPVAFSNGVCFFFLDGILTIGNGAPHEHRANQVNDNPSAGPRAAVCGARACDHRSTCQPHVRTCACDSQDDDDENEDGAYVDEPIFRGPDGRNYIKVPCAAAGKGVGVMMQHVDAMCCRAFHGPPPYKGAVVVHLDDDFANDHAAPGVVHAAEAFARSAARVQNDWHLLYWAPRKTFGGKTLQECADAYGVGGWVSKRQNMAAALVFLDARCAADLLLAGCEAPDQLPRARVRAPAEDADPGVLTLCPRHGLGARLASQPAPRPLPTPTPRRERV